MKKSASIFPERLGGKRGAGVLEYGVRGPGVWKTRGVENTGCGKHGVWKTQGMENTECGKHKVWKTRGLVGNTGSGGKHGVWWKTLGLSGKHGV